MFCLSLYSQIKETRCSDCFRFSFRHFTQFGILGDARVNVLKVNLMLDGILQ